MASHRSKLTMVVTRYTVGMTNTLTLYGPKLSLVILQHQVVQTVIGDTYCGLKEAAHDMPMHH